jgi:hypothetical protein
MQTYVHRAECFLEWEMLQKKVVEKIKVHFMFSNFFYVVHFVR